MGPVRVAQLVGRVKGNVSPPPIAASGGVRKKWGSKGTRVMRVVEDDDTVPLLEVIAPLNKGSASLPPDMYNV